MKVTGHSFYEIFNFKVEIDGITELFSCRLGIIYCYDRIDFTRYNLIMYCKQKCSYSLVNEKTFIRSLKIMRRLCFNRCFKGFIFHTLKNMKNNGFY